MKKQGNRVVEEYNVPSLFLQRMAIVQIDSRYTIAYSGPIGCRWICGNGTAYHPVDAAEFASFSSMHTFRTIKAARSEVAHLLAVA